MSIVEGNRDTELDERYGRTRRVQLRTKVVFVSVAGAFVVVFGAWLLWAGIQAPASSLDVEDVGHVITSDSSITLKYQLTVDPGIATKCAMEALNEGFGVVGWKIVSVPASDLRVRVLTGDVRTTEQAVSGLIYRCWPA